MLSNIVDVEQAMMRLGMEGKDPGAIFFDFKAAFPSVSHRFLITVLERIGIPPTILNFIRAIYDDNIGIVTVKGRPFGHFRLGAGIRQGCPLSPLLFAVVADLLLRHLQRELPEAVERAYADDLAMVVHDIGKEARQLMDMFEDYAEVSGLSLNLAKVVVVPLGGEDKNSVRERMAATSAAWGQCEFNYKAKYLGVFLGPGKGEESWKKPLQKLESRAARWRGTGCSLMCTVAFYNVYLISVLMFVAQLEDLPAGFQEVESRVLRKLVRGPAGWMEADDLKTLKRALGFPAEFRCLQVAARAAKFRVLHQEGAAKGGLRIREKEAELLECRARCQEVDRMGSWGNWWEKCCVASLAKNDRILNLKGITRASVLADMPQRPQARKQPSMQKFVVQKLLPRSPRIKNANHVEERLRYKLKVWKMTPFEGPRARRAVKVAGRLGKLAPPSSGGGIPHLVPGMGE